MLKRYLTWTLLLTLVAAAGCKKDPPATESAPAAKKAAPAAKATPTEKAAPEEKPPPPAPPEPKEPEKPAELVSGKGIKGMLLPGLHDPMDLMFGASMKDIAGKLAMEPGEHGTKVKKPIKLEIAEHKLTGDGKGKLKTVAVLLQKVPGGLKVGEVTLTPDYNMEWIKKELKGCKEEDGGKKLTCDEGKVVYTTDDKSRVTVTLTGAAAK